MNALYVRMYAFGESVHLVRHAGPGAITLCGREPSVLGLLVLKRTPERKDVCRSCIRSHRRIYGSDLPPDGDHT